MKKTFRISGGILLILTIFLTYSCEKDKPVSPILSTADISAITQTTATSGGNITSDGGETIISRGVCWSTSQNPTIADSKSADGTGTGAFTSSLTGLTAGTTYYVRAYATNSAGIAYGNELSFLTSSAGTTVTDIDGNIYNTVTIGTQVWMKENLKTTKYKDGTSIPLVTDGTAWSNLSTPGYCWYNNDAATYKTDYGALYNWHTVNTGNLCPTGWHAPTDTEWTTLENYLIANGYNYDGTTTGNKIAKSLASTTLWTSSSNTGSVGNTDYPAIRNATGFTALPGGYRYYTGSFDDIGNYGHWWSSTEYSSTKAWYRFVSYDYSYVYSCYSMTKNCGFSVRCARD